MLESEKYIKAYQERGLFTILDSNYYQEKVKIGKTESLNFIFDIAKEWDSKMPVPRKLGYSLEKLLHDPNFRIGVHKTDIGNEVFESEKVKSIMENGLVNYGDAAFGAVYDQPDLSKTVSFPQNILDLMIILKSIYKNGKGGFLLAFPRDLVDEEGSINKKNYSKIYNTKNKDNYINPKYIIGYIGDVNGIMHFFSKENLLNKKAKHL